jgi:hypothetical protein
MTLDENDLKIEILYRAIRVTHEPSGLVAICGSEGTASSNRTMAIKIIKTRLESQYYDGEKNVSKRNAILLQQRSGYTLVSRCTSRCHYTETDCDATYWSDGTFYGSCGDPCSFVMKKAGSGDPPFLHSDDLMTEIENLMLRKSRGDFRKG